MQDLTISDGWFKKDNADKPVMKSFKLAPMEETLIDMIEKAREIKESITKKLLPKRTKCFLCDGMCPYATKCFVDERTKL